MMFINFFPNLDWEFPLLNDQENFILLLQELKNAFQPHNKILSADVNPCASASIGYDIPRIF